MSWYDPDKEDSTIYKVVVNHEEQYSIWPADRQLPLGWQAVGKEGAKTECLSYIKEVWTDMRPLSLRKQMEEMAKNSLEADAFELGTGEADLPEEDDLVKRLSSGDHPVEADLRPQMTAQALKERIDLGYVHIKFTDTRGGTGLGIRLDRESLDIKQADFDQGTGTVHLEGGLTLNYVKLRCIADLDLSTLTGKGHLAPVEA